jgi:UDP:flavonoid glycosyltransferase YjiC (YdhE family)
MERLKVAKVIQRADYKPRKVASELKAMLSEPSLAKRAKDVAQQVNREDGMKTACDALETLHTKTRAAK